MNERMPPMDPANMNDAQRAAAAQLVAGPRKGVFGPFIPLLRSPELMDRIQRVGEYLRFENTIPTRLNEWATLIAARHWTNQFEWAVHYPLAIKAGVAQETLDALARRRRHPAMAPDESLVHDVATELLANHALADDTYRRAVDAWGEQGVVDLIATLGYFAALCMLMNAVNSPAPKSQVAPLEP